MVALPVALFIVSTSVTAALLGLTAGNNTFLNLNANDGHLYSALTNTALATTLVTNIITTGERFELLPFYGGRASFNSSLSPVLITWKLWRVNTGSTKLVTLDSNRALTRLLRIIVESGLLYTTFVIISLVSQCGGDIFQAFAENMVRSLYGLL